MIDSKRSLRTLNIEHHIDVISGSLDYEFLLHLEHHYILDKAYLNLRLYIRKIIGALHKALLGSNALFAYLSPHREGKGKKYTLTRWMLVSRNG